MDIISKQYNGSGNWVTARESHPEQEGDTLYISNAEWSTNKGRAVIDSRVVYNSDDLAAVWVTYYYNGRYSGGSQYYQYYRRVEGEWKRLPSWKSLDDGERMLILDNVDEVLPSYAKSPGKLKRDYLRPRELQRLEMDEQGTIYGYKYLGVNAAGQYYSPQKPECIWHNGELEADQEPTEDNRNGIYAMKSVKNPHLQDYAGDSRVLVRLALSGTVVEANEGLRAQHAQIAEVLS